MAKRDLKLHTKHVATYLTVEDFKHLDSMALDANLSLSSFVRVLIKTHIRKELSRKKTQ